MPARPLTDRVEVLANRLSTAITWIACMIVGAVLVDRVLNVLGKTVEGVAGSVGEAIRAGVGGETTAGSDPLAAFGITDLADLADLADIENEDSDRTIWDPTLYSLPDPEDDRIITIEPGDSLIPR